MDLAKLILQIIHKPRQPIDCTHDYAIQIEGMQMDSGKGIADWYICGGCAEVFPAKGGQYTPTGRYYKKEIYEKKVE